MTQNIYDSDEFFEGYSQLERSVQGLAGAAEWPSMQALLPDLRGLAVVDLGCGFGWFCRWAREQGAARVLGLDVSRNMLARATAMTQDEAINYAHADLEQLSLSDSAFDLAYSSLALHYIEDLSGLAATVYGALAPSGRFVFSVEHPLFTAPTNPGWVAHTDGRKTWALDSYMIEGQRTTDWITKGVIKHHRTIAAYLNLLIGTGFVINHVEEWSPSEEQIAANPEWDEYRHRPMFLLVSARR